MPTAGSVTIRPTGREREDLDTICRHLLLEPEAYGARTQAVLFALRYTAAALRGELQPGASPRPRGGDGWVDRDSR